SHDGAGAKDKGSHPEGASQKSTGSTGEQDEKKDQKNEVGGRAPNGHGNAEELRIRTQGHGVAIQGFVDVAKTVRGQPQLKFVTLNGEITMKAHRHKGAKSGGHESGASS